MFQKVDNNNDNDEDDYFLRENLGQFLLYYLVPN